MKVLGMFLMVVSVICLLALPFNTPTNLSGSVDSISLLLWGFCGIIAVSAGFIGFVLFQSSKPE